jgi:hypothetical protein
MKILIGLLIVIGLATPIQAQDSKGNKLPLVYDPLTKKYFIGGNSKFMLKQSEQSQFIERIEVSVDGGEYRPYGEAVQFKEEGKHTLKFRAVTSVNNWSPVQFVEVFVDLTMPTTEAKFPDEKFHKDEMGLIYVAQNSPMTFVAQDNLSGVANIQYSWDGQNFNEYTKPVILEKTGKQTLYYRSNDRVGNTETVKRVELIVDGTAPNSSLKLQNAAHSIMLNGKTYFSDSVAFAVEAQDDISKVKQIWVSTDGAPATPYIKPVYFLQEGPHVLKYYSVDNVGNRETEKSISLYTVSTPPQTILTTMGKMVNTGGINYVTKNFQLKLEANNNAAGLERIEVKVDSEADFKPYIEPVQFKTAGFHTVSYRALDRVGNSEPTKTFNVTVHEQAPETTIATAQPLVQRNSTTYSPAPNVLTFNVSNSTVGVEKTLVSINDSAFTAYQGPITLNNDQKMYKVSYKSVDKLGNEEQPRTMTFHMIGAIPIVDLFISNGQSSEEQVRTNYLEQPAGGQVKQSRQPASESASDNAGSQHPKKKKKN